MLLRSLYQAFEDQIVELAGELNAENAVLAGIEDDGEAAALARFRVSALELKLRSIEASRALAINGDNGFNQSIERFIAWRQAVAAALAGQERVIALEPRVRDAQQAVDQAEEKFAHAQGALADYLNHPLPNSDFAPPSKVKKWNHDRATLEGHLQQCSRELGEAKQTVAGLRGEWVAANAELNGFGALAFKARMLTPPNPPEPQRESRGTLSGVNIN